MPQDMYSISPSEAQFPLRRENALQQAHSMPNETLDANTRDEVIDAIVDEHAAQPVELYFDQLHAVTREQQAPRIKEMPSTPMPLRLEMTLPCTGAVSVLDDVQAPTHGGQSWGARGSVHIGLDVPDDAGDYADELEKFKRAWIDAMRESQTQANAIITEEREKLREAVALVAGVRHDRRAAMVRAAADAMIPLAPVSEHSIPIPLTPTRLTLQSANSNPGDEAALADRIADDLIDMIRAFSLALERSRVTANRLLGENEESIRDVLLFVLNANWQGAVTGETFLCEGKTDIHLRWKGRDAFIGECKFWKGASELSKGLEQVLDGYTVWRATRVALILFIRDVKDVSQAIDRARGAITAHPRFRETVTEDVYRIAAQHDEAQVVTLTLVPVILPKPVVAEGDDS